jgi:hypothetical protein
LHYPVFKGCQAIKNTWPFTIWPGDEVSLQECYQLIIGEISLAAMVPAGHVSKIYQRVKCLTMYSDGLKHDFCPTSTHTIANFNPNFKYYPVL